MLPSATLMQISRRLVNITPYLKTSNGRILGSEKQRGNPQCQPRRKENRPVPIVRVQGFKGSKCRTDHAKYLQHAARAVGTCQLLTQKIGIWNTSLKYIGKYNNVCSTSSTNFVNNIAIVEGRSCGSHSQD